jgi:4-hydroxy-tetrahydrodipicolinate synthase
MPPIKSSPAPAADSDAAPPPDPCPIALRGILPSLNTPFLPDGRVDEASLRRLIDHTVAAGAEGLLCNAVAAEVSALSAAERRRMLEVILEQNAGRITVIAGVSADHLDEALRLAREARALGAPAINWRAPAELRGPALERALGALAAAGPDLLVLQDLDFAGPGIPVDEIVWLFERIPEFRSVKVEAAVAGPKCSEILARTGGRLHVCSGWPVTGMIDAFDRGVHGFMPSSLTPLLVRLYRLHRAGRRQLAQLLFERLLPLLVFMTQHLDVSIRVGKLLRCAEGVFTSEFCRPPVAPLDPRMAQEAARLVRRTMAVVQDVEALDL